MLFGDAPWLEMYGQWWKGSCRKEAHTQRTSTVWWKNWRQCWRRTKWKCGLSSLGPSGMHETGTYLTENKPTPATLLEGQWLCYKTTKGPKAMPMNRICTPVVVVVSYTSGSGYFVVCIVSQVWSKAIPCIPMPSQYVNLCLCWLVLLVIFAWFNKIPILVVKNKKVI